MFDARVPALAGEITGPPPGSNIGPVPRLSEGYSRCSYSGLNDTPSGLPMVGDPGGVVQSFGYFMSQFDLYDSSDPDQRASFLFPGQGCNPQRTGGVGH